MNYGKVHNLNGTADVQVTQLLLAQVSFLLNA